MTAARVFARYLALTVTVVAVAVLLLTLAAGFIEVTIWTAGVLGLQHALGMDTQSSKNYASSSGVDAMLIAALGFSSLAVGLVKHLNCEKRGCWRLGHHHPGHGRPVCRRHYHHDDVVPDPVETVDL